MTLVIILVITIISGRICIVTFCAWTTQLVRHFHRCCPLKTFFQRPSKRDCLLPMSVKSEQLPGRAFSRRRKASGFVAAGKYHIYIFPEKLSSIDTTNSDHKDLRTQKNTASSTGAATVEVPLCAKPWPGVTVKLTSDGATCFLDLQTIEKANRNTAL